ncbi:TonB-dependent receptor [Lysobacter psychrotolerans]|uniref:TonB-dependent receptor n=1 Tax=Montanilutibacter psychrotolerans TaxID=1327343 RepID=A0A3M8SY09_9GAMM|nr:TonB-dependent receptor [Lysobacter psychrotolerans]
MTDNFPRAALGGAVHHALLATAVLSTTALPAGLAHAQSETDAGEAVATDRHESSDHSIGTRVTGQTLLVIDREQILAQGLSSIGDVIQNLPMHGSAANTTFAGPISGETRVSLRNLGSHRALVLVNGRRWVGSTALDGATDLNSIPSVAVERIEVLTGSAAALYGSGAIGGVINIVMRDGIDGFEANAYAGAFSQGDGERRAYDLLMGHNGDRFSAMLALGYVDEQPVIAGDRRISREPLYGAPLLNSSATPPNGRFALCPGGYDPSRGFGCSLQTSFDGTPGTFTYDGVGSAPRRYSYAADHYNQTEGNHLLSPQERHSALASASFDFTHWLRLRTDVSYNRRQSEQLRAALPLALGTAPGAGYLARQVFISRDSVYNPFGSDVSYITRRFSEGSGYRNSQNVRTMAFNVALESNFMVGDRAFAISAGYSYASNRNETTIEGLINYNALRDALGPSFRDADGIARCGTPTAVIANCVPLNLLGAGSVTPEMLAGISYTANEEMQIHQHSRHIAFSGDLFQLPGGPLRLSLGAERRNEYGYSMPDELVNSGSTNGSPRTSTAGHVHSVDAWLALDIPLLADLPFAKRLDIDVATRRSKYNNFGETINGKFGFRWQPMDDLTVRGDWSEGFRAPSINELFQGAADSFPTISDPCNVSNFPRLNVQAQQRCIA